MAVTTTTTMTITTKAASTAAADTGSAAVHPLLAQYVVLCMAAGNACWLKQHACDNKSQACLGSQQTLEHEFKTNHTQLVLRGWLGRSLETHWQEEAMLG